MPRAFSDKEKAHIKTQLLNAGKSAFGQWGIKKTNVDELAKMAGISKGAFYKFFDSKEALYFEIIRNYEKQIHAQIYLMLQEESDDEQERLKKVLLYIFNTVNQEPLMHRLLAKEEFDYLWQRFSEEQLAESMTVDIDFSSQLVELWKKKGKLKIDEPEVITGIFRSVFFMLLHKNDIGQDVFPRVMELLIEAAVAKVVEK